MNEPCFQRKGLYLLLTLPMIGLYVAIAVHLWAVSIPFFIVYCALFVLVAVLQSYVCVCWQCPYVGKFAPCVGGFCLPSSQIARLFRNVPRSTKSYNVVVTLAFACFLAIIVLPTYFLYVLNVAYLLVYLGVVSVYGLCFLSWICPVCATRKVCPGGQTAVKLAGALCRRGSKEIGK